jgi:hypothetical protein
MTQAIVSEIPLFDGESDRYLGMLFQSETGWTHSLLPHGREPFCVLADAACDFLETFDRLTDCRMRSVAPQNGRLILCASATTFSCAGGRGRFGRFGRL